MKVTGYKLQVHNSEAIAADSLALGCSNFFCIWNFFLMRLGTVIGRVTLSVTVPALEGGRWLIVSPFTREHFQQGTETPSGMSKDPTPVVSDDLGGGVGQTV